MILDISCIHPDLIELLAHFNRERIPERTVHSKGSGAHGVFRCTKSISDVTMTKLFGKVGAECPLTVRFSTVGGESGSSDLARSPRGFSIKLKTQEGNLDWVFLNSPVFFIRDPPKFVYINHVTKRDPMTNLTVDDDSTALWDFFGQNPETNHQVCHLFGDRGIPQGWRHMNGYSCHTYKFYTEAGKWRYVQIHLLTQQGVKTFTSEEASRLSPDWAQHDLFESIKSGQFPKWKVGYQSMTEEEALSSGINIFDMTKTWPHDKYPITFFGEIELNKNATNYFAEVEQSAFTPSNLISGWAPSADPVLQARLFGYPDAARYRLGVNWQQIPVNKPLVPYGFDNFHRDGAGVVDNQGARPNYPGDVAPLTYSKAPSDFSKVYSDYSGSSAAYTLSNVVSDDFKEARNLINNVMKPDARQRLLDNVSSSLLKVRVEAREKVWPRALAVWKQVDEKFASEVEKHLSK